MPEAYVHRIGRTARAGADGSAVAFCADDERGLLRDIQTLTRQTILATDRRRPGAPRHPSPAAKAPVSNKPANRRRRARRPTRRAA